MGGVIRPFEKIDKPLERGWASVAYVNRRLQAVLGKLHFTGAVSTSADGQIQVNTSAEGGGCQHPFEVYTKMVDGVLRASVRPGWMSLEGAASVRPTLAGAQLTDDPPPSWAIGSGANTKAWVDLGYTPTLSSISFAGTTLTYLSGCVMEGLPVIRFGSGPAFTAPTVDWETYEVTSGSSSLLLATIVDGVVQQEWFGSAFGVIADDLTLRWHLGGI